MRRLCKELRNYSSEGRGVREADSLRLSPVCNDYCFREKVHQPPLLLFFSSCPLTFLFFFYSLLLFFSSHSFNSNTFLPFKLNRTGGLFKTRLALPGRKSAELDLNYASGPCLQRLCNVFLFFTKTLTHTPRSACHVRASHTAEMGLEMGASHVCWNEAQQ